MLVLAGITLAACEAIDPAGSVQSQLETPIIQEPGPGFSQSLAAAYQRYYLDEDRLDFPRNSRLLFYEKALRALQETPPAPVVITEDIASDDKRQDLLTKREKLSRLLERDHRPGDDRLLAETQAAFDCHALLIAMAGRDQNPPQLCLERFETIMARLERPLWPKLEYHVFFLPNRSVLERVAIETLRNIADLKKDDPDAMLVIAGHSDRRGGADANDRLALQRARAVRNILMQFGLREREIRLLDDYPSYPAFFALEKNPSPERQRRVSILVDRNLLPMNQNNRQNSRQN